MARKRQQDVMDVLLYDKELRWLDHKGWRVRKQF